MKILRRYLPAALYLAAAVAIVLGVIYPLWRVLLYFPQYPEGPLQVVAYASRVNGDLGEIDTLNQYIGLTFPHHIPELDILPKLLYGVAALAAIAALVRGKLGLWLKGGTVATLVGSAVWLFWRMQLVLTNFSAHPDPNAPLAGVMKPFTVPLIGTATIVQVKAIASFRSGTYLLVAAGVLLLLGLWLALRQYHMTRIEN